MIFKLNDPTYWHNLYQSLVSENNPTLTEKVIAEVAGLVIEDPYVELLRLTFLSEFSNPKEYIRLAGLIVQQWAPLNNECLTAIAALGCMRALSEPNRRQFIASIINAQLPKIITALNHHACELVCRKINPRIPERINRVMIIPSFFANPKHTPSMLTVNYATIFHQLGCRVFICAPQELEPAQMKNYHGAGRVVNLPAVDLSSWTMHIPKEVTAFVFDKSLSMDERYGKAIDLALQFDPDLVLCVGPYSPIASAFYSVRPVLALPTNTASFLGCADVWLRGSDYFMTENEVTWEQEFPMPVSVMHPYRIFLENSKSGNLTRTKLGISEDAVVLVTVGFRLSSEITPAWADQMCNLIAHYEHVIWVLIGDATPSCLSHLSPKKIINLGIQSRTVDYLDLCDVYVNPPRMGGGFSVLEAMGKACAVVSYADSDGGEKIGASAVKDEGEYFAKLHRLILNPEQRVHEGRQLAQRFLALYDLKQSESSLVNVCRLAVNHFKERIISIV